MDRRERVTDQEETLRIAMKASQARLWTAMPGIVQSFNATQMTVTVQPTISAKLRAKDGTFSDYPLPVLLDCPVLWQGGGGATITFPIKLGDECLVIFASRCIDAWWKLGGVQAQNHIRMHDLSDGFALIGVRSVPRAFAVDTSHVCLTSDDGTTFVKLSPTGQTVAVTAPGGINLNGVTIDSSGNLSSPATITASTDVVGGGKHLKTHTHSGVTTGSGTSGPPS